MLGALNWKELNWHREDFRDGRVDQTFRASCHHARRAIQCIFIQLVLLSLEIHIQARPAQHHKHRWPRAQCALADVHRPHKGVLLNIPVTALLSPNHGYHDIYLPQTTTDRMHVCL